MELTLRVDAGKVTLGLAAFRLGIQQRSQLMETLGAGQLVSIRRTFDESGSPAGSWAPLSPNTLRWGRGKYGSGHKLLVQSGLMENSIHSEVSGDSVVLGTSMLRARVHQFGFSGPQSVGAYSYNRRVSSRDRFAKQAITNKAGRRQTVRRKVLSGVTRVNVRPFTRTIHIPARPFLVFRPEDPERMAAEVQGFLAEQARIAGLGAE